MVVQHRKIIHRQDVREAGEGRIRAGVANLFAKASEKTAAPKARPAGNGSCS